MTATSLVGIARVAVCAFLLTASTVCGQAQTRTPSPSAIATAKEIIATKASSNMWDSIVPGVVDQAKGMFVRTNPMLGRDLNEAGAKVAKDLSARTEEVNNEIARLYASTFTEQELKDLLTFYKSPLGRKVITEEPKVFEQGLDFVRTWTDKIGEEAISRIRAEMKKKGHDL
jgi:uncharacterized protein